MTLRICTACGIQQSGAPDRCPICEDERQFVPEGGQRWTTAQALRTDHRVVWRDEGPGLHSLIMEPKFAIGQRAFLIEQPQGNILWDCITLLDEATRTRVNEMGGLRAIAISHPHYYSAIADWGRAFGAPVYVHADDAQWIQERADVLRFWEGETLSLGAGFTLIRCGGHFAGASVLHAAHAGEGRGALFSGDTIQVVPDRAHVSFMRSYPNLIPLNAEAVRRIAAAVEPFPFDAIYGAFPGRTIATGARAALRRSAERYIRAISPGSAPDGRNGP
jgi:glyoxylase-like metal-dependent hydrolase (beta-lactamase superfamily II)